MQSGAINRITAKHIALASQSLQMMITMIPYIKNAVNHVRKENDSFDRIVGDLTDSRQNLHAELLKIMSERISVHALELTQKINWDTPDSSMFSSNGTSLSMYSLMNETTTFHKIISKYLDKAAVAVFYIYKNIMDELFQIYLGKLKHEFLEIEVASIDGRKRLLEDCKFLSENLEQLDNCDFPSSALQVFVMENVRLKSKSSSRNGSMATISTFNSTASRATVTSPSKSNGFSFFRK